MFLPSIYLFPDNFKIVKSSVETETFESVQRLSKKESAGLLRQAESRAEETRQKDGVNIRAAFHGKRAAVNPPPA